MTSFRARATKLWFSEYTGNKIGRILTGGSISEYPVPTASSKPENLSQCYNVSNCVWFVEGANGKIGRFSLST